MNPCELIKKKRDGRQLSKEEIRFLVSGFLNSRIPDCQMAAFLMAIYFSGMSRREAGGRYVESAAFNPSLTPLQSAISCMNMDTIEAE